MISFPFQGMRVEVRFPNAFGFDKPITLAVRKITQHPFYAETECFIEPCGPTRYNVKNDISVIQIDESPLKKMKTIRPVCLPDPTNSYLLKFATKTGQNVKAFKQPSIKTALFSSTESFTWSE